MVYTYQGKVFVKKRELGTTKAPHTSLPILPDAASKQLELVLQHRMAESLQTSHSQFGFKPQHGTELAIFTLKETIKCYLDASSPVFVCFLDASKAFDRVNHAKLFKI